MVIKVVHFLPLIKGGGALSPLNQGGWGPRNTVKQWFHPIPFIDGVWVVRVGAMSPSPANLLVNLLLIKLVRISGFSSLFSAIAEFLSTFVGRYKSTAIAEEREENPEILTNLVRKGLTRKMGRFVFQKPLFQNALKLVRVSF